MQLHRQVGVSAIRMIEELPPQEVSRAFGRDVPAHRQQQQQEQQEQQQQVAFFSPNRTSTQTRLILHHISAPHCAKPRRSTLNATLETLHHEHHTINTTPCTQHPTPYTQHPTPYTSHPKPGILDPKPSTINTTRSSKIKGRHFSKTSSQRWPESSSPTACAKRDLRTHPALQATPSTPSPSKALGC